MRRWICLIGLTSSLLAQMHPPPPFVYVILPVPVGGAPDMRGDLWADELWIHNFGSSPVEVRPGACRLSSNCFITIAPGGTVQVQPSSYDVPYTTLQVGPDESTLHFGLRTHVSARTDQSAGTEMPVIRPSALLSGKGQFLDVPSGTRFGVKLRLHVADPVDEAYFFTIRIFDVDKKLAERTVLVHRSPPPPPAYVGAWATSLIIEDLMRDVPWDVSSVRVEVEPHGHNFAWAFISVTDHETEQVSVITPQ